MIAFPRRAARRFRATCARCTSGRPRGPAPCVVLRRAGSRVTLTAAFPDMTLELSAGTTATGTEVLVVPVTVLDTIGGAGPDLVELGDAGRARGTARWTDTGAPTAHAVELIPPGKQHDPLPRPEVLRPVPKRFQEALHEAGRISCRDDGRFALSRVQVRGQKGQVIATDGKVAVIFGGFAFPFAEDLLVPAIPLFGCPEFRDDAEVRVGRTPHHVVVNAGDWTVWLGVAAAGRFPDVAGAIPKPAPTAVALDPGDAARLLPQLPQLPGRGHELRPVTLDADGVLKVRGREDGGDAKDVVLAHSPVTGPPANVVLDRRTLARMFALGCTRLRLTPDRAVVGTGEGVTVLAAPLDPELAVPPSAVPNRTRAHPNSIGPIPDTTPEKRAVMKPLDSNGGAHTGRRDPPPNEPPDPLVAAEELRDALGEALSSAGRLIAALKASRKEKKVLASVWATLDQLRSPPKNGVKP